MSPTTERDLPGVLRRFRPLPVRLKLAKLPLKKERRPLTCASFRRYESTLLMHNFSLESIQPAGRKSCTFRQPGCGAFLAFFAAVVDERFKVLGFSPCDSEDDEDLVEGRVNVSCKLPCRRSTRSFGSFGARSTFSNAQSLGRCRPESSTPDLSRFLPPCHSELSS